MDNGKDRGFILIQPKYIVQQVANRIGLWLSHECEYPRFEKDVINLRVSVQLRASRRKRFIDAEANLTQQVMIRSSLIEVRHEKHFYDYHNS